MVVSVFQPEDIARVDVREYVLREQARFFRSGAYHPAEVASQIALEALLIGASEVRISRQEDWISIFSERDWISGLQGNVFHQLVPIHGAGQNSVTSEVLLTVFSPGVVTATNGTATIIKGDSFGPLANHVPDRGRVVAFVSSST
jgi:hypothetical protein